MKASWDHLEDGLRALAFWGHIKTGPKLRKWEGGRGGRPREEEVRKQFKGTWTWTRGAPCGWIVGSGAMLKELCARGPSRRMIFFMKWILAWGVEKNWSKVKFAGTGLSNVWVETHLTCDGGCITIWGPCVMGWASERHWGQSQSSPYWRHFKGTYWVLIRNPEPRQHYWFCSILFDPLRGGHSLNPVLGMRKPGLEEFLPLSMKLQH